MPFASCKWAAQGLLCRCVSRKERAAERVAAAARPITGVLFMIVLGHLSMSRFCTKERQPNPPCEGSLRTLLSPIWAFNKNPAIADGVNVLSGDG